METPKFVGYVTLNDDSGKPISVVEVKTTKEEMFKNLVKQANENKKAKVEQASKEKQEKAKQEKEEKLALESRLDKLSITLAYLMFNELVERGKVETTDEFEDMFACWLVGKCEIAIELCPQTYLDILERLGLDYGRD